MKRIFSILLVFCLSFTVTACGNRNISGQDSVNEIPPEETKAPQNDSENDEFEGLASWRTIGELDWLIEEFWEQNNFPGMAISVFTNNEILTEIYYGHGSIEKLIPLDTEIVFTWESVSKLLVWVSVMQLHEQRKLDLNADIEQYLPDGFLSEREFMYQRSDDDDPITLLHLMNHTSGLVSTARIIRGSYEEIYDLEHALKQGDLQQWFKPGSRQDYSSYGAALAAFIVEQITGIPFYEYVFIHIFAQLNMENTTIKPDLSNNILVKVQIDRLNVYNHDLHPVDALFNQVQLPLYPAGGAVGTLLDMSRFANALMPGSDVAFPLFEKPETFLELFTATYIASNPFEISSAHGFYIMEVLGENVVGHSGMSPWTCTTYMFLDYEKRLGVVMSINQALAFDINTVPILIEQIFNRE
jgi:CubicO group peptidase (beta-lactamase class C family)